MSAVTGQHSNDKLDYLPEYKQNNWTQLKPTTTTTNTEYIN